MKPKNTKERRNSFLKFLLLFLVTVGIIITSIFFNFKVPQKENVLLKSKLKTIDEDLKFQKEFAEDMKGIQRLVDSTEIPGAQVKYLNTLIDNKLADLQNKIPSNDTTYRHGMYSQIVKLNFDLQSANHNLRKLRNAETTIEKLQEDFEKSQNNYTQALRDLDICRRSN